MALGSKEEMRRLLLNMGRKGFLEALEHISKNPECHYNDVLRYLLDNEILEGRAYVTTILNMLVETDLVERSIEGQSRPIRTTYRLSKNGKVVLKLLEGLEPFL
jgi:DNA-binding HxlR family transcriptional regulator